MPVFFLSESKLRQLSELRRNSVNYFTPMLLLEGGLILLVVFFEPRHKIHIF